MQILYKAKNLCRNPIPHPYNFCAVYIQRNTEKKRIFRNLHDLFERIKFTALAVINIFHGVSVPIPCNIKTNKIKLNLSRGGLISILARSIVIPIENNYFF